MLCARIAERGDDDRIYSDEAVFHLHMERTDGREDCVVTLKLLSGLAWSLSA